MHRFGLREICPDELRNRRFQRYHIPQTEGTAAIAGERGESPIETVHDPGAISPRRSDVRPRNEKRGSYAPPRQRIIGQHRSLTPIYASP
jgi:hypothetical protein